MARTARTKYYVWRRNDGYVASTANRMPGNYRDTTFTLIEVFDNWQDARECIIAARTPKRKKPMGSPTSEVSQLKNKAPAVNPWP